MARAAAATHPPAGLVHVPELISREQHDAAVAGMEALEMRELRMRGQVARRTVMHFGWHYDYDTHALLPADPLPSFLEPLRDSAADMAGLPPADLEQALVNRYPPGATIGWHRDSPMFGTVIGISLVSPCRMRFQRGTGAEREVYEVALEPRSGYVLAGEARTRWQHSIPAVKELRWSVTFPDAAQPAASYLTGVTISLARVAWGRAGGTTHSAWVWAGSVGSRLPSSRRRRCSPLRRAPRRARARSSRAWERPPRSAR